MTQQQIKNKITIILHTVNHATCFKSSNESKSTRWNGFERSKRMFELERMQLNAWSECSWSNKRRVHVKNDDKLSDSVVCWPWATQVNPTALNECVNELSSMNLHRSFTMVHSLYRTTHIQLHSHTHTRKQSPASLRRWVESRKQYAATTDAISEWSFGFTLL